MDLRLFVVLALTLGAPLANAQTSKIMLQGEDAPGANGQFMFPGSAFATSDGHVLFGSSTTTVPIPTLPPLGLMVLVLALGLTATRFLERPPG